MTKILVVFVYDGIAATTVNISSSIREMKYNIRTYTMFAVGNIE